MRIPFSKIRLKIASLKLHLDPPGTNKLTESSSWQMTCQFQYVFISQSMLTFLWTLHGSLDTNHCHRERQIDLHNTCRLIGWTGTRSIYWILGIMHGLPWIMILQTQLRWFAIIDIFKSENHWRNTSGVTKKCYSQQAIHDTVLCHYNVVNFLTNIHKRHPHSSPVMLRYCSVFLWMQHLNDILPQFLYLFT